MAAADNIRIYYVFPIGQQREETTVRTLYSKYKVTS